MLLHGIVSLAWPGHFVTLFAGGLLDSSIVHVVDCKQLLLVFSHISTDCKLRSIVCRDF